MEIEKRGKTQYSVVDEEGWSPSFLGWDLGKLGLLGEEDRLIGEDERQLGFRVILQ